MSGIDPIAADLAAMTAGLGKAQEAANAADNAAAQIAQRAAGSGFAGIAQNMSRVRDAIREIAVGAAAAGRAVAETGAPVAAAPTRPSPRETIAVLAPIAKQLDTVHGLVAAVIEQIGRAKQLAASVLQGGQPGPLLARLDAIREILVAVAQRGIAAKQNVEAAVAEVRRTGDAGNRPRVPVYSTRDHRHPGHVRPQRPATTRLRHRSGTAGLGSMIRPPTWSAAGNCWPGRWEPTAPPLAPLWGNRSSPVGGRDGGLTWWRGTYVGTGERIHDDRRDA